MTQVFLSLALALVIAAPAGVQQPRDLSGTWTMDEARSGSPSHDTFVGPVVWRIQHSPAELVVERQHGGKAASFTYAVLPKAPEVKADTTVTSPPDAKAMHRAYWDGDRLITETLQNIQGKTVTTREVLMLSADGRELQVERIVEVEHGYTMKGAQNFNAVKDVFKRATP